ncbi:hypothetical protein [Streptomyces sp. SAI-090]|nr:hypothetical protein [Streptomyces sp. SAI-090]MDH6522122.1 hypothetical protein [Streptomyces sp. SAI-090]
MSRACVSRWPLLFDATMSGGQLSLAARTATPRVIDGSGTLNADT